MDMSDSDDNIPLAKFVSLSKQVMAVRRDRILKEGKHSDNTKYVADDDAKKSPRTN